jgi:hypothetical protein
MRERNCQSFLDPSRVALTICCRGQEGSLIFLSARQASHAAAFRGVSEKLVSLKLFHDEGLIHSTLAI